MSIDHKYFSSDKNHLLKTVQAFGQNVLIQSWTKYAFEGFMIAENPLGLEDDFTQNIRKEISQGAYILNEAYDLLAAVHRFRSGNNQLAFMWDGRTHMEFYDEEWRETFAVWSRKLSAKPDVYRAIIKAALADSEMNTDFLKASIRRVVLSEFKIKLTRAQKIELAISA